MNRSKPILSLLLKRNIVYVLLLILIVLTSIFLGFEYYYRNNLLQAERDSVITSVRSFLEIGSNMLIQYNDTYQTIAEEKLLLLSDAYLQGGISRVEKVLRGVSFDNKNVESLNYYLIEDGTITETNYPRDRGLNLADAVPIFWKNLQSNLLETDDIFIENISYEIHTNKPRIYAYRRIDADTLFEVGLHIENSQFAAFIDNLSDLEIKSNIRNIETYNIKYIPFREEFSEISQADREIFESLKNSQEEKIRDLPGSKKVLYIKWVPQLEEIHSTINTKVTLDFSKLSSLRNRFFILMLVVLPLISILMIFINYRNSRRFLDPLSHKITSINASSRETGSVPAGMNTGIYELDALESYYSAEIEKRERINAQLHEEKRKAERSLQHKEVLLREIHHRVKNNLNIIASLIRLQSSSIEDGEIRKYFTETQNRITSMSLIHEKLLEHDIAELNFEQYLQDLISQLVHSYDFSQHSIRTRFDIPDMNMNLDTAIPLGLVLNELITNSLHHGLEGTRDGVIDISVTSNEDSYLLTVRDNGRGVPEDIDPETSTSLGLSLITTLAKQLQGSFHLRNENGAVAELRFRNLETSV